MDRQSTTTTKKTAASSRSKLTKKAAVLFAATVSVYFGQALLRTTAVAANPAAGGSSASASSGQPATGGVKLLDNSDPFASGNGSASATTGSATQPATQPSADAGEAGDDATAPASQGTSVNSTDVTVSDTGTVEIHVNDANLVEVLRMLSLQSQKNIVASKDVSGKVTANLYGVTVREALDAILKANGYAYREKGNFIYVYTTKEIADIEKSERVTTTEIFRLYYTPAANAMTMIKPVLSTDGQVAVSTPSVAGIASGAKDVGGGSHATEDVMVVTDYPDNLEKVRKVLREVDRRPQQILVEATILRAALTEDNALGVDFNIVGGVDFASVTHSNGQITGAGLPTAANGGTGNIHDGVSSVGSGNNFTNGIANSFRVGYVTNNIAVFLAALESVTDTTVLANPKVLALNKQSGEVIVGRKDGYITTTVTETTQTQSVEFLDTGTRLIFRPFVGDDGYIRMEIHPEDSSGGLSGANLPFKITTEVTSNIMVKDGHTVLIGGLFRESATAARNQVPLLGNMPLIGPLFRNQHDQTTREEIIILLTPHIVKDDAAYSQMSEQMLADAEKVRVGVRKGMMGFGRERMAEGYYEKAIQKRNQGDKDAALWFLGAATDLNPKFMEAIHLKEDLSGKVVTTADNSSVRTFIRKEMLMERPAATTTTVPPSVRIDASPSSRNSGSATTRPVIDTSLSAAEPSPTSPATSEPSDSVASTPSTDGEGESSDGSPATQPSNSAVAVGRGYNAEPPTTAPSSVTELPESSVSDQDMNKPGWYRSIRGFLTMFDGGQKSTGNGVNNTAAAAAPTEDATHDVGGRSNGDH